MFNYLWLLYLFFYTQKKECSIFARLQRILPIFIIILLSVSACTEYSKALKEKDKLAKLNYAKKYYNRKDYVRAQPLLEDLMSEYLGREENEMVHLYVAYTQYGLRNYLLAAHYFESFAQTYPLSDSAVKAKFMNAYCYYHKALPSNLDQTNTKSAIDKFQIFINQNPTSKLVSKSNEIMDELRAQILDKAYENAKQYYKIRRYKSAIVAIENALADFPDIPKRDELYYLKVKSSFEFAKNSISETQLSRYRQVKQHIYDLKSDNPKNEFMSLVNDIENKTDQEISRILQS